MTADILLLSGILGAAVFFFVTGWLRVDLVALLVLISLALTGLATPSQSLAGFSNPAVVTVWAVFILSGGLARTGVAGMLGRQILRVAGSEEVRLILVIMVTSGFLSAFMNNVGVAEMTFTLNSGFLGRTLRDIGFRRRFGVNVVGILRKERLMRTRLADITIQEGDVLLIEGPQRKIEELKSQSDFHVSRT